MKQTNRTRRERVPELRKQDALFWAGKPNSTVPEPVHVAGYSKDEIENRVIDAMSKPNKGITT